MSFSRSSAPSALASLALALLVGCGPSDGSRELAAGRAAYEAGNLEKAGALLLKSERLNATNADTQVCLALVNLRKGALAEAEAHIERAEALAGGDVDVRLLGAQIAWHRQDAQKALRLFASVAEDASLDAALRARGWTGLGIAQMTSDAYDLARISFLRAIRLDRMNASARYHLGHLYRYAPFAYPEMSLEQFEIFVRLAKESDARVQKTLSAIIPSLKDAIAQSTMDVPGAATRNSSASAAALSRAEKAWKKGSYAAAAAAYREAFSADPLAYPAAVGLARALAKTATTAAGRKQALDCYRKACALRPSAVSTLIEAGDLAERLGQVATARGIFSRAVAANPASPDAIDGLIRALRKAGDKSAAAAYQSYRETLPRHTRR